MKPTTTLAQQITTVETMTARYNEVVPVTYAATDGDQHNQHVHDFKDGLSRHIQLKAATLPYTALSRATQQIANPDRFSRHSFARFCEGLGLDHNPADVLPLTDEEQAQDALLMPAR